MGQRFPHVAELFYERGPAKGRARIAAYLAEKMAQGEQRNGDPLVAAMQLFGLCHAGSFHGVFFGMQESPPSGQPSATSTRTDSSPPRGKEFTDRQSVV